MNYREFKRANELYGEINKINDFLKIIKTYSTDIKVSKNFLSFNINDDIVYFSGEHKQKFVNILKKIKEEMIEELNELGVVEDDK